MRGENVLTPHLFWSMTTPNFQPPAPTVTIIPVEGVIEAVPAVIPTAVETINAFIEDGLERSPVIFTRCELGPGKRAFLALPETVNGPICLFAEAFLPARPKNPKLGWNPDEIVRNIGAMVPMLNTPLRPEKDGRLVHLGMEMIPLDLFTQGYVTSKVAGIKLERTIESLQNAADMDDDYVQQLNLIWQNRDTDIPYLGGPRYLN